MQSCLQIGKSSPRLSTLLGIVARHPTAGAYDTLGALYAEHGHGSCAIESFRSALRLDPRSWQSRYNLSVALFHQGKLREAEAQLRKAIQQDPKSAAAHNALGLVLEKVGLQDQAEEEFKRALQINSGFPGAALNLAQILSAQGKFTAAIYYLTHALKSNPPADSVLRLRVALGVAYGQDHHPQRAIAILKKTVAAYPESVEAHLDLGAANANEQTPDGYRVAAKEFQEALRLDPRSSRAQLSLGRALLSLQRYGEAITVLKAYIRREPSRYEGYYYLGQAYRKQGEYQQAAPALQRAASLAPSNFHVRFNYGLVLVRVGRVSAAKQEFQAAERIKPGDPEAHYQLALLLKKEKRTSPSQKELQAFQALQHQKDQQEAAGDLNNKANKLLAEGKYQEAAAIYRQVLKMNPDNAKWHYNFSLALAGLGERNTEEHELETVVRLDPSMDRAQNELGLLYMGDGRLAAAEHKFKSAISINPQDAEAQNNLGVLFSREGKDRQAGTLFRDAVRSDPHYIKAYVNLGLVLARQGNYYIAEQQFETALQIDSNDTGALTALGMLYSKLGHRRKSIKEFQKVVDLDTASADAHLNLGIALADGYDPQAALKQFSEAVRLAPKWAVAYFNKGRILYDLDRNAEARTELEIAHRLAPNYAPPLYFLAVMDNPSVRSIALLRQLIKLQPRNSAAQALLGQNLMREGKTAEAIQHWEIAVKVDPSNSLALYNLARALARTHDPEAGIYLARFQALQKEGQMKDRVHQLNNFALEAAQHHNWPLALEQLQEAMKACGQCRAIATLHKNLGLIYARKGDTQAAIRELELALKEDPQNADAQKAVTILHQVNDKDKKPESN